jgi:hypothetical protein
MMIYNSVAEIFDSIEETRGRLVARLSSLSEAGENFRSAAGGWSVAEIAEHLALLESRLLGMMTVMINKAEKAGLKRNAETSRFNPVSLEQFTERARREKYNAPDPVCPTGKVSVRESLESLRQSRESLRALRPRIEATDLGGAGYAHPAFGQLDFYQWLLLIGFHEDRHLRQIEALLASPEYEAQMSAA